MEGLGINLGLLILQILSFLIVFVVLNKWLFSPLAKTLEKRRNTIAQGLEDARVSTEARARAEKDAANIVQEAEGKAVRIINDANERAEKVAMEMRTEAEHEIIKMRESSLADIQEERDRVLAGLRGQVASLAIAAAQKLIGETLDERRQHALLAEFFSGVKSGKVVVLEGVDLSGGAAQVTSALPLKKEEQEAVKKDILAKMGKQATVAFRVDPSILGGLVIRVGDKVLDGSVVGKLEGLHQSLR